jgi:hypothetical protein
MAFVVIFSSSWTRSHATLPQDLLHIVRHNPMGLFGGMPRMKLCYFIKNPWNTHTELTRLSNTNNVLGCHTILQLMCHRR